jgi:hypothetical protein
MTSLNEFLQSGGSIQVIAMRKPRKSERTFPANKGSVFNIGAKAFSLSMVGLTKRKHG